MIEIVFSLNQMITKIQGNLKEPFKNVIDRYIQKSNYKRDELCFLGNGGIINENEIIENLMNIDDKNNNRMNILVEIIIKDENGNKIIKSKDIICPECKESCRIKIENYKIKLFECPNGHMIDNIKLIDFDDTQKINIFHQT